MLYSKKIIGTIAYMGGLPAVLEKFCWAWGQMIQCNNEYLCGAGEIINYTKATVSLHSFARNSIVEQIKGEWLLMLDTDHAFEPDIAIRLLTAMNRYQVDVVSAMYCHRGGLKSPVIYQWSSEETLAPVGDWDDSAEAFEIGSAGAGTLLVRASVFKRIKDELEQGPFDILPPFGEDHSFFKRLKKLGIKSYVLPNVESPHIEVGVLRVADYNRKNLVLTKKEIEGFR